MMCRPGARQQMVDIGDAAGDRNCRSGPRAVARLAIADSRKRVVLEGGAGQQFAIGKSLQGRLRGEGLGSPR